MHEAHDRLQNALIIFFESLWGVIVCVLGTRNKCFDILNMMRYNKLTIFFVAIGL